MYEFYVFEWQGIVWLYDDNERTHACSSQSTIYAYPVYGMTEEDQDAMDYLEPKYFDEHIVTLHSPVFVLSVDKGGEDEEEILEEVMEEVQCNHPI